jgi:hypothetical protein
VLHRAVIERYEDKGPLHMMSATEIKVRILELSEFVVLQGEHDTLVVPFKDVKSIHVYETGAPTS